MTGDFYLISKFITLTSLFLFQKVKGQSFFMLRFPLLPKIRKHNSFLIWALFQGNTMENPKNKEVKLPPWTKCLMHLKWNIVIFRILRSTLCYNVALNALFMLMNHLSFSLWSEEVPFILFSAPVRKRKGYSFPF